MCDSASIVKSDRGISLVGLFGDGKVRAYSIPSLKEISSIQLSDNLDVRRFGEAQISLTGCILGWVGPSELFMVHVWGSGFSLYATNHFPSPYHRTDANRPDRRHNDDTLFNPTLTLPARPTISNLQWISGTQYISTSDMDLLGM